MPRPAPPAVPTSGTLDRLSAGLGGFIILLTLLALVASQFLVDRLLRAASAVRAEAMSTLLVRFEPDLPALLRGAAPEPDQLERLAQLELPDEVAGLHLMRGDGSLLVSIGTQQRQPATPPLRHQASGERHETAQAPIHDDRGQAGHLLIAMAEKGHRKNLREAFRMVQAGMAGFGAISLLLLIWLSRRSRRLEASAARARHLLRHDMLTGLATHAELHKRLELSLVAARPGRLQVGVLVLNLRGFRDLNAQFGRAAGDAVLAALAQRLRGLVRRDDTVARLSADRFAVVQTALHEDEDATTLAERLANALAEPLVLPSGKGITLALEIGLATAPRDGEDAELLLARAEAALSSARGQTEPSVRSFEPAMDMAVRQRRQTEADLRQAIIEQTLVLHYQPQRSLVGGKLLGFEALIRWPHPTRGLIPPIEFIPIAEQTGLIVPLGAWVIRAACAEAAHWPEHCRVAVNLSPAQFRDDDLVSTVADALAQSGLPASRLELEVTESLLQEDPEDVIRLLRDLRGLGVSIAMDDFGTGWSSLANLWRFPFGKLKIDRAFVKDLAQDPKLSAIIATVVGLGRILGMTVIAEGVETEEQARILAAEGCEQGQGWLYGRPMPAEAARRLIAEAGAEAARNAA